MFIINSLAPLFFLILVGAFLARRRIIPTRLFSETNRLVFYLALPALLFMKAAAVKVEGGAALRTMAVVTGGMLGSILVSYGISKIQRIPRRQVGALVQGSYRGNIAYIALPLVLYATTASDGAVDAHIQALAVAVIAAMIPVYNVAAVIVLLANGGHASQQVRISARDLLRQIVTNPLIIACFTGIGWSLTGWEVPVMVGRTLEALGQMSLPLALLGIGGSLTLASLQNERSRALTGATIKLLVSPAIGLALGLLLGLTTGELQLALIYLGAPTAVASYVMAQQLGSDESLAGSIVVVSTLVSMLSLAVILFLFHSGLISGVGA